ncbi:TPA: hypothetical protein R8G76_001378 [Citrobacter youngae]|nr:hypothetical protein [Citrobacter youngae]
MTALNKQALRQLATDAHELGIIKRYTKGIEANKRFAAIATPLTFLALLDEIDELQERGKAGDIRDLFLRAKHLMYQSGGSPIENSLNPIDAWLYDAEHAAAQPAPVVPDEKPMPEASKMYAIDAVAAIAEVRGWNACRDAMLQAGNFRETTE